MKRLPANPRTRKLEVTGLDRILPEIEAFIESRTPDIHVSQNVRFFSSGRLANSENQEQPGTWKDGFGLIEFLAECGDGTRAMRRTLRGQGDA